MRLTAEIQGPSSSCTCSEGASSRLACVISGSCSLPHPSNTTPCQKQSEKGRRNQRTWVVPSPEPKTDPTRFLAQIIGHHGRLSVLLNQVREPTTPSSSTCVRRSNLAVGEKAGSQEQTGWLGRSTICFLIWCAHASLLSFLLARQCWGMRACQLVPMGG